MCIFNYLKHRLIYLNVARIESSALAANVVESVSVGGQFSSCAGEYDGVDTLEVQAEYLIKYK